MTVKSVILVDTLDTDARGARLAGIIIAQGISSTGGATSRHEQVTGTAGCVAGPAPLEHRTGFGSGGGAV